MIEEVHEQHPLPELFSQRQWRTLARRLELSPRQVQIARLICLGHRNNAIPKLLGLHDATVRMHRRILYRRVKIHERVGVPVRMVLELRGPSKANR